MLQSKSVISIIIVVILSSPPQTLAILRNLPLADQVQHSWSVAFKCRSSNGSLEQPLSNWLVQASIHNTEDCPPVLYCIQVYIMLPPPLLSQPVPIHISISMLCFRTEGWTTLTKDAFIVLYDLFLFKAFQVY